MGMAETGDSSEHGVRFRLLGPLEVFAGSEPVPLGSRQRAVLSVLLLHVNRVTTPERLVDMVWDAPAATPRSNLRTYIAQLRRRLPDGSTRILTHPSGYVLRADAHEVDVLLFTRYVRKGVEALRHQAADAGSRWLEQALHLWRGQALEGIELSPALQAEAEALNDARVAAWEQYIRARLLRGDATDLVVTVRRLISEQPLRESLWRWLMLVLHHAGRKAEALAAYDGLRERLAEEFGCAPAQASQALMRRIASDESIHEYAVESLG